MADVDVAPLCRRGNWARVAALRGGCARVQMASRQAAAAGLMGTAGGSEHRGTVDKSSGWPVVCELVSARPAGVCCDIRSPLKVDYIIMDRDNYNYDRDGSRYKHKKLRLLPMHVWGLWCYASTVTINEVCRR